jgi:predicted ArsR family transcriptional regulator
LYEYVLSRAKAVGREEAAMALGLAQHKVNFHFDRLADEGLLDVEYRRLSGKNGPGAGRPSKLYRRSRREFAISLPQRRYDLMGEILASAIKRVEGGAELEQALRETAREEGHVVAKSADRLGSDTPLEAVLGVLAAQGFEPHLQEDVVVLANCPFGALARTHTALICGLNKDFVQGFVDGLGSSRLTACLEPESDRCCVVLREVG